MKPDTKKKTAVKNFNGNLVAYCEEAFEELSLGAIGLYFSILYGMEDKAFDEESVEALKELWAKNYITFQIKQK